MHSINRDFLTRQRLIRCWASIIPNRLRRPRRLKNSAYVGSYRNDFFGEISIIEKDSGLASVQGPKNQTSPMKHYDRDTFTYEVQGENPVVTIGVTFTVGPDGKAAQVVVENLNARGEGAFKRVPAEK